MLIRVSHVARSGSPSAYTWTVGPAFPTCSISCHQRIRQLTRAAWSTCGRAKSNFLSLFATNAVLVNGQTAYRKGEYFRKELLADNSSTALWTNITVSATGQSSISGHEFVPKTPEDFYYDADGNLTNDGRWTYTWDAENRLLSLTPNSSVGPQSLIKFAYDWRGRRIHKQVWPNTSGSGYPTNDVTFVYDGWNLLAELNATNNAPLRSYVWGLDLSGSPQGAGGVGGLLFIGGCTSAIGYSTPAYDGNGNLAALVSMSGGTNCATYEYGPFGEIIRQTGPMAKANPFRFSTKYQDDETDLVYYGYRYLNASTGRWLSRDPVEEQGFRSLRRGKSRTVWQFPVNKREDGNLYALLRNSPLNDFDLLGLCEAPCLCGPDVTRVVYRTLQDIGDTYVAAPWRTKIAARLSLSNFPTAVWSWDILYLYNYSGNHDPYKYCNNCKFTVTFEGTCVHANELNYIMWGYGIQLCENSEDFQTYLDHLRFGLWLRSELVAEPDTPGVIERKVGFAAYGAGIYPRLPSFLAWPYPCTPLPWESSRFHFESWRWWPLKWVPF